MRSVKIQTEPDHPHRFPAKFHEYLEFVLKLLKGFKIEKATIVISIFNKKAAYLRQHSLHI